VTEATQRYFDRRARAYDRRYGMPAAAQRLLRPGPGLGRELAALVVAAHERPSVLDLGCGPGRVAEAALDAGAARYVGVDLSPRMLGLTRERLAGRTQVELIEGDFSALDVAGTFDVVLALGLFDYVPAPARAAEWMHERCSSTLVASFTCWDWLKGPVRHARYRLHRCRVADYTADGAAALLAGAGFENVEFAWQGRRGFLVTASGG